MPMGLYCKLPETNRKAILQRWSKTITMSPAADASAHKCWYMYTRTLFTEVTNKHHSFLVTNEPGERAFSMLGSVSHMGIKVDHS
jgi:hypothetical protein